MSTLPPPFSSYACLTELVQASVSASFKSCSVSSESGRTPAIALRARRPSVMYSARAGMVRRTERHSSLIAIGFPTATRLLTRRSRSASRRSTRVRILVALVPAAEPERQLESRVATFDGEAHRFARREVRDDPRNVFRTRNGAAVDRDDHVTAVRKVDPEHARGSRSRP